MALSILWGDDEHTAVDGPYSRLLKTRKWIYISAALAVALSSNVYQPDAAQSLVKIIAVPIWFIGPPVLGGLIYLLIQYALLRFQLTQIYEAVLNERFKFRRQEELEKAAEKLQEAEDALDDAVRRQAEDAQNRAGLNGRMLVLKTALEEYRAPLASPERPYFDSRIVDYESEISRIEEKLAEMGNADTSLVDSRQRKVIVAEALHRAIEQEDPASHPGYVWAERVIDAVRTWPPLFVGIWSATRLALELWY